MKYITPEEYERAARNGISEKMLNRRVRYMGWDKERAITTPPVNKINEVWLKKAAENNIPRNVFYNRVYMFGWDRERASTEPVHRRKGI